MHVIMVGNIRASKTASKCWKRYPFLTHGFPQDAVQSHGLGRERRWI